MRKAPTGSALAGAMPPRPFGPYQVGSMPVLVLQLSAMATSPATPFGDGVALAAGAGVGVGVGVGVTTAPLDPPSVAAPVGLALLVPQAEVRTNNESANAFNVGCAQARFNISFLKSSKRKKTIPGGCTTCFNCTALLNKSLKHL